MHFRPQEKISGCKYNLKKSLQMYTCNNKISADSITLRILIFMGFMNDFYVVEIGFTDLLLTNGIKFHPVCLNLKQLKKKKCIYSIASSC